MHVVGWLAICWPAATLSAGTSCCAFLVSASHFSKSACGCATTFASMSAWPRPQNSVHWPRYSPGSVACTQIELVKPGTASIFPESLGTQNEWMTSTEPMLKRTFVFNGMCASVFTCKPSGYLKDHCHCRPVTSIVIFASPTFVSVDRLLNE